MQASEQTGGIFDVTCAPLINLWGFGFTKFDSITPQLVDSIRHFVGFRKVRLQGNRVMKDDPRILLNFSVLGGGTICNIKCVLFIFSFLFQSFHIAGPAKRFIVCLFP